MKVEITDEAIGEVVAEALTDTRGYMAAELLKYQHAPNYEARIFHVSPEKDRRAIKKLVKALDKVLEWYS